MAVLLSIVVDVVLTCRVLFIIFVVVNVAVTSYPEIKADHCGRR